MNIQLPPPSPALALHQAADKIRRSAQAALAEMASNDYWRNGWAAGVTNAIGGSEGDLAALLSPEAAIELADVLDTVGSAAARRINEAIPAPLAAFADRVARTGADS
jgi:hypothetical protein